MFYFSQIVNAPVRDKNDVIVGRVKDLAIDIEQDSIFPPIKCLLLNVAGMEAPIEASAVAAWSKQGIILRLFKEELLKPRSEEKEKGDGNILFLGKHIVDKQIVDLAGVRVVRVNDLQFDLIKNTMSLVAIDVSTSGLLRRLGFKRPWFNIFRPHLLEWKNVHVVGDKLQLMIGKEELTKLHPADIANIIEKLNLKQGSLLLSALDEITAAKVMEEVSPEIQKMLVQHLGPDRAADIMEKMSMDELVDLIQLLPARESREIIANLPVNKDIPSMKKILEYDEDTAGGLMTTEYVTASPMDTIAVIREKIRRVSHQHRSIYFVYIVDEKQHFLGVVSLRRLIVAHDDELLKKFMKRIERFPSVKPETSLTKLATMMTKYNLLSASVVDDNHRLLGIVTIDDIMRCLLPKA